MPKPTKDDLLLLAIWLLVAGLIGGLSYVNPNQFTSPDSTYYLAFAGWLVGLDGNRYGHVSTGWDGTFPLGYPLLIGLLAKATGLSLLVASKVLNVGLVAVFLLIWRRRLGARRAVWVGSVLLLGGFVRILTYTWSEWTFLVLLLEWAWFMGHQTALPTYATAARLLLVTMGLFLLRYVGGYVVIVYGLQALWTYTRGAYGQASRDVFRQRIGPDVLYVAFSVGLMLGYFYLNARITPSAYGGERFYETAETIWDKLLLIAIALPNELLLLRDYVIGEPTSLVWLGLVIQLGLGSWGWRIVWEKRATLPDELPAEKAMLNWLLLSAGVYLTILFTMRLFSPFNGPNARLMAPVTLPFLWLLAQYFSRWTNVISRRQLGFWWTILLLCSWLQLLPQADLLGKLGLGK
ncbi:hypothetical protein J2I47_09865 [Fibrella sp. HMF5335]|uniref:Uncharacterized protein n=1 Tax=Fibrella rubiginis TaxID=2817060 RepID=A0A939K300_9BACT|nr:hypothetical protein [Fibrella rubiginis]MBO0936849.1 hypothetical protein [Fibrella rubiginis]